MRASGNDGEVSQLLRALNYSPPRMLAGLRGTAGPPLDVDFSQPLELFDFPPLAGHVTAVLDRATQLRDESNPSAGLDTKHVLGALLDSPDSSAYFALQAAAAGRLGMEELRDMYIRYLRDGGSFGALLGRRLRSGGSPSGTVLRGHVG